MIKGLIVLNGQSNMEFRVGEYSGHAMAHVENISFNGNWYVEFKDGERWTIHSKDIIIIDDWK